MAFASKSLVNLSETISVLTQGQETRILEWLQLIGENDQALITETLYRCRNDPEVREYFLGRAKEAQDAISDDRRTCKQCANITASGFCLAARRGLIKAGRDYRPIQDTLMRCSGFNPSEDDPDQRSGCERWPGLDAE